MKLLNLTCVSATFEIDNNDIYYPSSKYDVYLNDKVVLKDVNKNVFTLFDLTPDTSYRFRVNNETGTFVTKKVSKIYDINPFNTLNDTYSMQQVINAAEENSLIRINEGNYKITALSLKSNTTLEIRKNAYLKALTDESLFQQLDKYFYTKDHKKAVLGTWEGNPWVMKKSLLTGVEVNNVNIVGEGIIDGDAQNSKWWVGFREKPYARPHMLFLNHCTNINVVGVEFRNSPCWTIHPFYSKNVNFYDFKIDNPKVSPNTDGIDPQSCENVNIIGIHFSVGDDCVSIKSGKIEMIDEFYQPCININIRNCLMEFGHGAMVLGSEMSAGIKHVMVERCYFRHTDRGLRIKTRRGRGNKSIVDDVTFKNIRMEDVLSPLTINMFYNCDPGSDIEYIYSKDKLPVDEMTPYIGEFTFENIKATGCEYVIGYFYGLPEMPIRGVKIINSSFEFKDVCGSGQPVMMKYAETCSKRGIVAKNVDYIKLENVTSSGYEGKLFDLQNVKEVSE